MTDDSKSPMSTLKHAVHLLSVAVEGASTEMAMAMVCDAATVLVESSAPTTIYIVEAHGGQYEDSWTDQIKAFVDKDKADALCNYLTKSCEFEIMAFDSFKREPFVSSIELPARPHHKPLLDGVMRHKMAHPDKEERKKAVKEWEKKLAEWSEQSEYLEAETKYKAASAIIDAEMVVFNAAETKRLIEHINSFDIDEEIKAKTISNISLSSYYNPTRGINYYVQELELVT